MALELLAHFGREAGDGGEVEGGRDAQGLVLAQGGNVELLARDVGGVAGIDGDLGCDGWGDGADLGPDGAQQGQIDLRQRQQVEGRTPAPILVDTDAVAGGLPRGERARAGT